MSYNKKETNRTELTEMALLQKALFPMPERYTDINPYTLRVMEITKVKKGVNAGMIDIVPKRVPDVSTGELQDLIIEKACLASAIGLLKPMYFSFNKMDEATTMIVEAYWEENNLVPFGSGIKGEHGQSKFYAYPEADAIRIFGDSASDITAYGSKLFTDVKMITELEVLVLDYEEAVAMQREAGWYTEDEDPGYDGSGYVRKSAVPNKHSQFVAVEKGRTENLAIAKGAQITLEDDEFDRVFGDRWDMVMIKKDQIKTNYNNAVSGTWTVGWTWNTLGSFEMPVMWEFTQFLRPTKEVETAFKTAMEFAIKDVEEIFSTKENIVNHLAAKINTNKQDGKPVEIEQKLLRALTAKRLPFNFKWIQVQIENQIVIELGKAIKCYGVKSEGNPLWTDDVLAKTNPMYENKEVTHSIGGDNDFDLYGRFVDTVSQKQVSFRYPIVGGFGISDIGDERAEKMEDCHPEIVDVVERNYVGLDFSRADIKEGATRIREGAYYARHLASRIMKDAGIGMSTLKLKRAMTMYYNAETEKDQQFWLDVAKDAAWQIEASAIGLKYHVKYRKSMMLPKGTKLNKQVPMAYRNFFPKKKDQFNVEYSAIDMDGRLHNAGIAMAKKVLAKLETDTLHPRDVYVPKTMAAFNQKFVERVNEVNNYYKAAVASVMQAELDEDTHLAAMRSITKSVEAFGNDMTVAELQAAIGIAFQAAGEENTGAFAIHLAGTRLHEVFGGSDYNVECVAPEPKPNARQAKAYRVWTKQSTDVDTLRKSMKNFKFLANADLQLGDVLLHFSTKGDIPADIENIELISEYRYPKAKKVGKEYKYVSDKSFWVTCS